MRPWKDQVKEVAPWVMHGVRFGRWLKHQVKFPVVALAVEVRSAGRIMSGPFKNLRVPGSGIGDSYYATLLGTYETTLVPVIEAVIRRTPDAIIDVGACWGYYALGLAMRCPQSNVIAYEMDATRADLLQRYRRLNKLDDQVQLRGLCTAEALESDLAGRAHPFVLMDVEGTEDELLDPQRVPSLVRTEILVEMHDLFVPGVTARIRERFKDTHRQTLLPSEPPIINPALVGWVGEYPALRRIARRMVDERRGGTMWWLHLRPRAVFEPSVVSERGSAETDAQGSGADEAGPVLEFASPSTSAIP